MAVSKCAILVANLNCSEEHQYMLRNDIAMMRERLGERNYYVNTYSITTKKEWEDVSIDGEYGEILFYYTGHGVEDKTKNEYYELGNRKIFGYNIDENSNYSLKDGTVNLNGKLFPLYAIHSNSSWTVILDCCYPTYYLYHGMSEPVSTSITWITSCQPGGTSKFYLGQQCSLFTYWLNEYLHTGQMLVFSQFLIDNGYPIEAHFKNEKTPIIIKEERT